MQLSTILVGRNKDSASELLRVLDNIEWIKVSTHIASNGHADLISGIKHLPEILIVDLSHLWREELEILDKISPSERPHIIVVGDADNAECMRRAMQIGARDYFTYPIDVLGIKKSLEKISLEHVQKSRKDNASIISLVNGKGGSGATMIASNLAFILSAKHGKKVALIDLHCDVTSLPLYFDIAVNHTLTDVLTNIDSLDETGLEGSMVRYSDKLHILSSRNDLLSNQIRISESSIRKLLRIASGMYDYIILDLPSSIDSMSSSVLRMSNHIYLILQQSIPHLNETGLYLNHVVKEHGVSKDKIKVIINRYLAKDAIKIEDIKNSLCKNVITIPSDYKKVCYSLNIGQPLYVASKRSAVTRSIAEISDALVKESNRNEIKGNWKSTFKNMFANQ